MNKTSDINARTEMYAVKSFLEVFQPMMVTQRFAHTENQPKGNSRVRKWRRYLPLPVTKAPVAEGITPESYRIKYQDIQVNLQQFGGIVETTDVIMDVVDDPIMKITSRLLAEQAANVIEGLTIDVLKSGTNVIYANGVGRSAVNTVITKEMLRRCVRTLDRNGARTISSIIGATPNISTAGVEAAFYALGHTDLESDLRNLANFKTTVEYGNPGSAMEGEIGAHERIRFILTQNFTPWTKVGGAATTIVLSDGGLAAAGIDACDVYPLIILGRDAYGAVRLQGKGTFEMYVLNPGVARGGDPIGQRGTAGWKTWYAAKILTENYLVRLEVAASV